MNRKINYSSDYADRGAHIDGVKMQEIIIDSSSGISAGERSVFVNANIHINTKVYFHADYSDSSEYELEFKNCVIQYGEKGTENSQLKFRTPVKLLFTDCTFICSSVGNDNILSLFEAENSCTAEFSSCRFESCKELLTSGGAFERYAEISVRDCFYHNCGENMLHIYNRAGNVTISDCLIKNDSRTVNQNNGQSYMFDSFIRRNMFAVFNDSVATDFIAYNNVIINVGNKKTGCFEATASGKNVIKCCTFIDSQSCISQVKNIENCLFTNCTDVIDDCAHIDSCCFEKCDNIVYDLPRDGYVKNSRFIGSRNSIINAENGQSLIFNCQFLGAEASDDESLFFFTDDKFESEPHFIRHCVFDNISVDEGYIVDAKLNPNKSNAMIARLRDCTFSNLRTRRSDEKVFHDTLYYDFLLWKNEAVTAVDYEAFADGLRDINGKCVPFVKAERLEADSLGISVGADLSY